MIEGIDVSEAQGVIDWLRVGRTSVAFAACKATEGNGYVDHQFAANWNGIRSAGITVRGSYHFAHPDSIHQNDAAGEAEHFVRTVGALDGLDFLALDIEDRKSPQGRTFTDWVVAFCERVDDLTGRRCLIYTGGPFFDEHDGVPDPETVARIAKHPLWLAAYVTDPTRYVRMTAEWGALVIHQASGDEAPASLGILHVDGIHGNVDRDRFPGTLADLQALVRGLRIAPTREPGLQLGDGGPAHDPYAVDRAEAAIADTDRAPPPSQGLDGSTQEHRGALEIPTERP
jgi:GH25 family lysozyme M1 (1,4-beta-N-acetylmuramidase)